MRMRQQGAGPIDLLVWASSWYGAKPDPQLSATARLSAIGNEFYGTAPDCDPSRNECFLRRPQPTRRSPDSVVPSMICAVWARPTCASAIPST